MLTFEPILMRYLWHLLDSAGALGLTDRV